MDLPGVSQPGSKLNEHSAAKKKLAFALPPFFLGSSFGWELMPCLQETLVQILAIPQMSDSDFSTLLFNAYISEMGFIVTSKSPED